MYDQKAPFPASEITRDPTLRVEPTSEYTQTIFYQNKTTPLPPYTTQMRYTFFPRCIQYYRNHTTLFKTFLPSQNKKKNLISQVSRKTEGKSGLEKHFSFRNKNKTTPYSTNTTHLWTPPTPSMVIGLQISMIGHKYPTLRAKGPVEWVTSEETNWTFKYTHRGSMLDPKAEISVVFFDENRRTYKYIHTHQPNPPRIQTGKYGNINVATLNCKGLTNKTKRNDFSVFS